MNHSRYLDYYAKDIGDNAYNRAKLTPTAKQIKFYKQLYAMCKANGLECTTEHAHTRSGYAMAIDKLIQRLKESGINIGGNGKEADYVLEVGEDRRGRYYANERIRVGEEGEKE